MDPKPFLLFLSALFLVSYTDSASIYDDERVPSVMSRPSRPSRDWEVADGRRPFKPKRDYFEEQRPEPPHESVIIIDFAPSAERLRALFEEENELRSSFDEPDNDYYRPSYRKTLDPKKIPPTELEDPDSDVASRAAARSYKYESHINQADANPIRYY